MNPRAGTAATCKSSARAVASTISLILTMGLLLAACGGGGNEDPETGSAPRPTGAQANDPQLVQGRRVFVANCARCHGAQGQGGVGPQLAGRVTSRYPAIEDQKNLVRDGRGIMPSFGGSLSEDQIDAVVRYTREVL